VVSIGYLANRVYIGVANEVTHQLKVFSNIASTSTGAEKLLKVVEKVLPLAELYGCANHALKNDLRTAIPILASVQAFPLLNSLFGRVNGLLFYQRVSFMEGVSQIGLLFYAIFADAKLINNWNGAHLFKGRFSSLLHPKAADSAYGVFNLFAGLEEVRKQNFLKSACALGKAAGSFAKIAFGDKAKDNSRLGVGLKFFNCGVALLDLYVTWSSANRARAAAAA